MDKLNLEKALETQGFVIAPVNGDSMLPMLDERTDSVKIVPVNGALEKYDLPLYRRPGGQLVLHRIVEVHKNHYITCGDNRKLLEKVPKRWVIGVTEGYFKNGKYISVTDSGYLEYVKRRCESFDTREILSSRPQNPQRSKLFPGYYEMVIYYPCLDRAPFLLPVMWAARFFKKAFLRLKRGKRGKK